METTSGDYYEVEATMQDSRRGGFHGSEGPRELCKADRTPVLEVKEGWISGRRCLPPQHKRAGGFLFPCTGAGPDNPTAVQ